MQKITQSVLEQLLLDEVRAVKGCETVEQVTTIAREKGDWIVGAVRPGRADSGFVRSVATRIESRMRRTYYLVQS